LLGLLFEFFKPLLGCVDSCPKAWEFVHTMPVGG
jgi:hypothetical protein